MGRMNIANIPRGAALALVAFPLLVLAALLYLLTVLSILSTTARRSSFSSILVAEAILLDWNLTDDGSPLPFSKEKAADLLADMDIGPLLREAVSYAASVVGDKGAAELDAAAGN